MYRLPLTAMLSLWITAAAHAEPTDAPPSEPTTTERTASTSGDSEEATTKRKAVFPPFMRKKDKPETTERTASAVPAEPVEEVDDGVDTEAPADDAPEDGIWEWVGRMDGEIPTPEQVEAIEEFAQVELSERRLVDELSGAPVPERFYKDPVKTLTPDPLHLDRVDPSEFDIPIVVNDEVAKWVRYFTGPGRKYYQRWLGRSSRYRPMMYKKLDEEGLPRDLVYLSMIESGYNAHAYSHASAAGLWQFIPSTARLYKLRVDWWVDDRRDPEAALGAATDFLSELHQMFGDWQLAWAAYNGGPGRIRRTIKKSGTNDFFTIARGPWLHPETDNYVPKIMAAAIIGHHPERYGFTEIDYQEELVYDVAQVDGSVELSVLARCAGTDLATMKALNPALRRFATPPEGYTVRVPVGSRDRFVAALEKVPKDQRVTVVRHTVERGQTLSTIAARYGVSVSDVSQANNLRNVNRIYVGMTLVIPRHGQPGEMVASAPRSSSSSSASSSSSGSSSSRTSAPSTYTVRKGDTLSVIASRYGTTVSAIKSRNGLRSDTIQVGQTLRLTGSGSAAPSTSTTVAVASYTVKRGDNLSSIASKFGVKTSDLQQWNGIRNPSHIQVGQSLKVRGASTQWKTYSVRSGDSLGKIASAHHVSVSELQQWNNLSGSVIHPGQELKIRVNG